MANLNKKHREFNKLNYGDYILYKKCVYKFLKPTGFIRNNPYAYEVNFELALPNAEKYTSWVFTETGNATLVENNFPGTGINSISKAEAVNNGQVLTPEQFKVIKVLYGS